MLEYVRKRIRSLDGAAQRLKNDTELFKQFMDSLSFNRHASYYRSISSSR